MSLPRCAAEFKNGVLLGQDAERKRVARELHDDIGQRLALVGFELNEAERLVRIAASPEAEEKLRTIRRRVESIVVDIHRISHNLHPATLVHVGLVSGLRALCADFSEHTHVGVEFTSDTVVPPPSNSVAIALYRVTQECLNNVARHSGSDRAHVALVERPRALHLTIADSGAGFDVHTLPSPGLGLVSIRERARRVGGDVQITSALGRGTAVTVRVPLDGRRLMADAVASSADAHPRGSRQQPARGNGTDPGASAGPGRAAVARHRDEAGRAMEFSGAGTSASPD